MPIKQDHLFVMDPLAALNFALDTSIRLAYALAQKGHKIYMAEPKDLYWQSGDPCASARACELSFAGGPTKIKAGEPTTRLLNTFNALHMRKDPPFDLDYIGITWLLESAEGKTKVYNRPAALRAVNEKLSILRFKQATAAALVSNQPQELLQFVRKQAAGDAVLKPLTLYGGKGILRVNLNDGSLNDKTALTLLEKETSGGKTLRLVQPFDKAVFQGEVRAFVIGGKPLCWCLKKPTDGQFLANSNFGSTRHMYKPSPVELDRVESVAKTLLKEGVSIVGFDLIGGLISEINITSPRLLFAEDDKQDYFNEFATWIISDCVS